MGKESKEQGRTGPRRGGSYVVDKDGKLLSIDGRLVGGDSKSTKKKTLNTGSKPQEGSK